MQGPNIGHLRALALSLLAVSVPLSAQCRPATDSNEAKLLAFYTAPLSFSPASTPLISDRMRLRLGFEGGPVPSPGAELRRTGACFTQKTENTELASFFARPRITLVLPGGFSFEGSYVPAIEVQDAKPHFASLAVAYSVPLVRVPLIGADLSTARFSGPDLTLRLHGTRGRVQGAITCPRGGLQQTDAAAPCYGTQPSTDTFRPVMVGAEGALSWWSRSGAVGAYAGAGVNWLRPRFQVGFVTSTGAVDSTRVEVDLTRAMVFVGGTARIAQRFDLSAQLYSVPRDLTTVRLGGGFWLR